MNPSKIVKERRIPIRGNVLVEKGEIVKPDTLIAKGVAPSQDIHELRLPTIIKVSPEDVKNHIVKNEGDIVEKDEVVALARSFFRRQTRMARSPIKGVIESFSPSTGRMLIRGHPVTVEVYAHIPGEVKKIILMEGAVIETRGYKYNGLFGVGDEKNGILTPVVESRDMPLTSSEIESGHRGKILLGGSVVTLDALREAERQGVGGIITGGIDQKDLTFYLGYEIGLGVTGDEDISLTLILMEGFGVNPINEDIWNRLNNLSGEHACIDGTTHVRSRTQRPEIIIPA